jgi:hypothetical protein
LNDKKYTAAGYLIISESDKCPLWEKDTLPCTTGWNPDCFFCKYADFRKTDYRARVKDMPVKSKLYSVCHNEKNKKEATEVIK